MPRLFLLAILSAGFAAAWSGDQRRQAEVLIAQRQGRFATLARSEPAKRAGLRGPLSAAGPARPGIRAASPQQVIEVGDHGERWLKIRLPDAVPAPRISLDDAGQRPQRR